MADEAGRAGGQSVRTTAANREKISNFQAWEHDLIGQQIDRSAQWAVKGLRLALVASRQLIGDFEAGVIAMNDRAQMPGRGEMVIHPAVTNADLHASGDLRCHDRSEEDSGLTDKKTAGFQDKFRIDKWRIRFEC